MFSRGIKNRVFIYYWIIIFLAMLAIDLPLFVIFLNRAIQKQAEATDRQLAVLCQLNFQRLISDGSINSEKQNIRLDQNNRFLFIFGHAYGNEENALLERQVTKTLQNGKPAIYRQGKIMGVLLPRPESLIISRPVINKKQIVAAGGIETWLADIYQDYRRLHTVTFVFILISSFFLALFGNRQLGRIYFQPLQRLAKRAESYQDEDTLFFAVRKEDNEFSVLSTSLNKMVHRIRENKSALKETIQSLKETNLELKKAQQEVIRAEKLATIGRLTSGIAHEIGNPIGIVLGYLDLLKQSDLEECDRYDFIRRSEDEISRINIIIRQLLDMSRPSDGEKTSVSIHQLLKELIGVFKYQPKSDDVDIQKRFEAISDTVFADSDQLRQVFLNIIINAIDAISGKHTNSPRIVLWTSNATSDDDSTTQRKIIRIGCLDNGQGISAEHLQRIFDPFFTTKEIGKGTGLGLSVSYMIIDKLDGKILARAPEEGGTEFVVELPLADHQDRFA